MDLSALFGVVMTYDDIPCGRLAQAYGKENVF